MDDEGIVTIRPVRLDEPIATILFSVPDFPDLLRLEPNGDIFVKGRLIENDKEIVDALRDFITGVYVK
jgi:hypothetical protein